MFVTIFNDWEQRKFGDFYKVSSGHAFNMKDYTDNGVPIVNGESIQHGDISIKNINYLPESFRIEYSKFLLKSGDIVLGLNRPITNGALKITTIPEELTDPLLYQRAGRVDYLKEIDSSFSYTLLSEEVLKNTLKEAVGSDQPFISTSKLSNWNMFLPSNKEEQKKLVLSSSHSTKLSLFIRRS